MFLDPWTESVNSAEKKKLNDFFGAKKVFFLHEMNKDFIKEIPPPSSSSFVENPLKLHRVGPIK